MPSASLNSRARPVPAVDPLHSTALHRLLSYILKRLFYSTVSAALLFVSLDSLRFTLDLPRILPTSLTNTPLLSNTNDQHSCLRGTYFNTTALSISSQGISPGPRAEGNWRSKSPTFDTNSHYITTKTVSYPKHFTSFVSGAVMDPVMLLSSLLNHDAVIFALNALCFFHSYQYEDWQTFVFMVFDPHFITMLFITYYCMRAAYRAISRTAHSTKTFVENGIPITATTVEDEPQVTDRCQALSNSDSLTGTTDGHIE
eukprot:Lankesteria_metandrocarpae@DN726_c0_g1_i1.p1